MSPVGGPRHYQGAGLGQVGLWACPSCGEDNTGAIEQGCVHCGAGVPRRTPPALETPPPPAPQPQAGQGDYADVWAARHGDASVSIAEAYRAGYRDGLRAARAAAAQQAPPPPQLAAPDAKTYRTVVAALAYFRDQILSGRPEEVVSGEWLSVEEANTVIAQLQQLLGQGASHAVHA